MKNVYLWILWIAGCLFFTGCRQEYPRGIEHVVVIGIDGMSVQGFREAKTPCMDSLMQNGAYNYKVRGIIPTVSLPNWGAMVSGAGPEVTGVTTNSWNRSIDDTPPVAMSGNHVFPNVFSVIREQMPRAEIGAIYDWGGFEKMLETEVIDKYATYSTQRETTEKAAEYIRDKKPNFLFIQLDEVDGVGHSKGHMSPEYLAKITETDGDVRMIVNAVKEAGINDKAMIVVVSDHGGIFYAHGGNTYEEFTTPIIYSGKGVKKNYHIQQQIYRYDLAADAIFALGLKIPQVWVGRPVKAAFEGFNEPENLYQGVEVLPSPTFIGKEISTRYGDLTVDKDVEVVIKHPVGVEGRIHYTIDGTTPSKESPVYTAPFTLAHSAFVKAKLFGEESESVAVQGHYRVARTKDSNGLNYSFYHLPGVRTMPSLQSETPVASGVCYEVAYNEVAFPDLAGLMSQYPRDYGIRFDGWIKIDEDAKYTFQIRARGGYRLFIDSRKIIEHETLNEGMNYSGSITLEKGVHPLRLEYFRDVDRGYLDLYYESDKFPARFIPGDKLFISDIMCE